MDKWKKELSMHINQYNNILNEIISKTIKN